MRLDVRTGVLIINRTHSITHRAVVVTDRQTQPVGYPSIHLSTLTQTATCHSLAHPDLYPSPCPPSLPLSLCLSVSVVGRVHVCVYVSVCVCVGRSYRVLFLLLFDVCDHLSDVLHQALGDVLRLVAAISKMIKDIEKKKQQKATFILPPMIELVISRLFLLLFG